MYLKTSAVPATTRLASRHPIRGVTLQGLLFALVGMGAGLMGTAVSNGLLILRQKLDPKFVPQNKTPNVLLNAATWATHMGLSSNIRYQMLNGVDMVSSQYVRFLHGNSC